MSRRLVVAVAGCLLVVGPGAVYAFTVLQGPLNAAFGWTPAQTQWAFALYNLFIAVGAIIGGWMSDRWGPRVTAWVGTVVFAAGYVLCGTLASLPPSAPGLLFLEFYFGVLGGTGSGMTYIAALNSILRWSKSKRGLASGFVIMGFGLGSFVFGQLVKLWPPFKSIATSATDYSTALTAATVAGRQFNAVNHLLGPVDQHNLMTIFLASGVIFFVVSSIAAFFIGFPPVEVSSATDADLNTGEMLADARFYVIWAMLFLSVFGGVMVISAASSIISEITGVTLPAAAQLYTTVAVCNGLGRFAFGALSDVIGRRLTFVAIFALQAASFMLLDAAHDPAVVTVAIAMMLLAYGGGFGTMPSTSADFFGTKYFGLNYGATITAWGLAAVAGTYSITVMKTFSGSYTGMMQPIAILGLVALFFPMIIETPRPGAKSKATGATAA